MNAFALTILAVLCFSVVCLPRRPALLAMLVGTLFLGQGLGFELGGLTLFPSRILGLLGCIRVLLRKEFTFSPLPDFDRLVLVLYAYVAVVHSLGQDGRMVIVARSVDALFYYVVFRGLVRNLQEVRELLSAFVFLLIPYAALLAVESVTGNNPFAIVGGGFAYWVRDGATRCFGSFRHPSILGSLGATFFPLYVGLAWEQAGRKWTLLGAALCVLIVIFSNSGGPLSVLAVGVAGWCAWRLRHEMQAVRRCIVAAVILLALVMKAPIWYLIARVGSLTGGSGYHRARLMEVAFRDLDKWWFVGMPIEETRDWFPYRLLATGGADITNQFVGLGVTAGLGAVVLAILLYVKAFRALGRALSAVRESEPQGGLNEKFVWGIGVMFLVHLANAFNITYFDQFATIWFLHLAMIASLAWVMPRADQDDVYLQSPGGVQAREDAGKPVPASRKHAISYANPIS